MDEPCVDTGRRWLSISPGDWPQVEPPCQHLDLVHLASRITRKQTSIVQVARPMALRYDRQCWITHPTWIRELAHPSSRALTFAPSFLLSWMSDWESIFEFFLFKNFFIHLFLPALGLCCCKQAFSSCGEWGLHSSCGGPASHCSGFSVVEHRF